MKALKRLELTAFRGASRPLTLDFDPSKPVIVLFGENGTGKTTVTDALDAVGNCSPGSIKDRSSTNVKEHLPTLGKTHADVEVRLEDTAGTSGPPACSTAGSVRSRRTDRASGC
jgi:recombinational DNA repair ATPase RecF